MRHVIPLILIAVMSAACGGSAATSSEADASSTGVTPTVAAQPTSAPLAEVYLPTYRPMEGVPAAEIVGRLVLEGGCLWIEHEGGRALPLWPAGSRLERENDTLAVVNSGGARAEVGTVVAGGGGEYGPEHYEFVVGLIGEAIPPACRGDGYYWLVYDVQAADE